jgi:hypothetical protein
MSDTATETIYEIANPSDAYTMKSADELAAVLACMFLGSGRYILTDESGRHVMPFFMFGGGEDEWLQRTFGMSLDDAIKSRLPAIADALESVLIGGFRDRREFEEAAALMTPENVAQFRERRHDRRRSSLNNIGRRAAALAKSIRAKLVSA